MKTFCSFLAILALGLTFVNAASVNIRVDDEDVNNAEAGPLQEHCIQVGFVKICFPVLGEDETMMDGGANLNIEDNVNAGPIFGDDETVMEETNFNTEDNFEEASNETVEGKKS